ncbi:MAG: sensor histidine kinase, partial [Stackebrandtia sp.]
VSPHTEINNATRVLTAAGIRATARFPEADLESEALRELGLLIRESTTNILRHAKAERADFDMTVADDHVAMRIRNDGIDTSASTGSGTGLVALGERFERAGGRLEWHRDGDKFTVTAQLPRKGAT